MNGTERMRPILSTTDAAHRMSHAAIAAMLAMSLGAAPLAAYANDDAPADAENATETAEAESATSAASANASSASAASDAATVPKAAQHALHAEAPQTVHSNGSSFITTAARACGVYAEEGATIVANALSVRTRSDQGPAVATSPQGGSVSIANSELRTSGTDAPLLLSAGTVEADNVTGAAAKSAIALVEGQGSMLVADSALTSSYAGNAGDVLPAGGVAFFSSESAEGTAAGSLAKPALFQASRSTLESAAQSGSLFYLTNTTASIVLQDVDLAFDSDSVKLLTAVGSDAAGTIIANANATANATTAANTAAGTTASAFGTPGKNGATATMTARDQELAGDIEVDSISSLDLFLLEDSAWTGSCSITANAAGTDLASNIVVNIDATSGWTVTSNSTASKLNIEKGGSLVDREGKAVTIVDADGNKLVDGASDVTVSVTGEFSTTVKTTGANDMQASTIDRSAFDEEFGTSTAFGTNGTGASAADWERAAELQAIVVEWFRSL